MNTLKTKSSLITISCIFLLLYSCSTKKEQVIKNVSRVFMHEPTNYTLVSSDSSQKLILHTFKIGRPGQIELITDVPVNQAMWAVYTSELYSGFGEINKHLIIHIHSSEDMEGGAWDHGKLGEGHTFPLY